MAALNLRDIVSVVPQGFLSYVHTAPPADLVYSRYAKSTFPPARPLRAPRCWPTARRSTPSSRPRSQRRPSRGASRCARWRSATSLCRPSCCGPWPARPRPSGNSGPRSSPPPVSWKPAWSWRQPPRSSPGRRAPSSSGPSDAGRGGHREELHAHLPHPHRDPRGPASNRSPLVEPPGTRVLRTTPVGAGAQPRRPVESSVPGGVSCLAPLPADRYASVRVPSPARTPGRSPGTGRVRTVSRHRCSSRCRSPARRPAIARSRRPAR